MNSITLHKIQINFQEKEKGERERERLTLVERYLTLGNSDPSTDFLKASIPSEYTAGMSRDNRVKELKVSKQLNNHRICRPHTVPKEDVLNYYNCRQ